MRLSRSVLDAYNAAVKQQGGNAENAARRALNAWLSENPGASIAETREFCIALLGEVGTKFGNAAGDAAYALRGIVADAAGVELPDVDYAYEPDSEFVEKTARYQVEKLKGGDSAGFVDSIADASRYFAERGANDTMTALGKADGKKLGRRVRFARVPMGATTCPYCCMLASRGFVYRSELSALNANHRHCDCRIVEGFEGMTVEGYDPDEYYDRWKYPEDYEEPGAEQRNIGPRAPINRMTSRTSIAECAAETNPRYADVETARSRRTALVNELNDLRQTASTSSPEYRAKYSEYQIADREYQLVKREYGNNCQRCVVAYELRRRGYDVVAKRRLARNDIVAANWDRLFVNQQFTNVGASDASIAIANLEREIGQFGDGSRSIVYVQWANNGGAHVFIAERQNGQVVYICPQTGIVHYDWQSRFVPASLKVSRVDNLEVDTQYLDRVVEVNR